MEKSWKNFKLLLSTARYCKRIIQNHKIVYVDIVEFQQKKHNNEIFCFKVVSISNFLKKNKIITKIPWLSKIWYTLIWNQININPDNMWKQFYIEENNWESNFNFQTLSTRNFSTFGTENSFDYYFSFSSPTSLSLW